MFQFLLEIGYYLNLDFSDIQTAKTLQYLEILKQAIIFIHFYLSCVILPSLILVMQEVNCNKLKLVN